MIVVDRPKVICVLFCLVTCTLAIALAPATVGEIAASTGQLSNRLKVGHRCSSGDLHVHSRRGEVLNLFNDILITPLILSLQRATCLAHCLRTFPLGVCTSGVQKSKNAAESPSLLVNMARKVSASTISCLTAASM